MTKIKRSLFSQSRVWGVVMMATLTVSINSCALAQGVYRPQGQPVQTAVYDNYNPPPWAPQYANINNVRHYYLPDYNMYYDAWTRTYWYQDNGMWIQSNYLPPAYAGSNLNNAYVVFVDRDVSRPWMNHQYYVDNYSHHSHDRNRYIVESHDNGRYVKPNQDDGRRANNPDNNRGTQGQRSYDQTARQYQNGNQYQDGNQYQNGGEYQNGNQYQVNQSQNSSYQTPVARQQTPNATFKAPNTAYQAAPNAARGSVNTRPQNLGGNAPKTRYSGTQPNTNQSPVRQSSGSAVKNAPRSGSANNS